MAKKKNSKKIQQKREKRNQQSRQKRKGVTPAPRPSGLSEFVERLVTRAWAIRSLPIPPKLEPALAKFEEWAGKLVDGSWDREVYPAQMDLAPTVLASLEEVFDRSFLDKLVSWLMEACGDDRERKALFTAFQTPVRTPAELPGVDWLLTRWGESLAPSLRRWIPLWCNLLAEPECPELDEADWLELAERAGSPLSADRLCLLLSADEYPEPLAIYLSGLRDLGCILGWSGVGGETYARIWREAVWKCTERATAPGSPVEQRIQHGYRLLLSLERMLEILPDYRVEEFLCDPQSPDWVLDLAQSRRDVGQTQDALQILLQLQQWQPEIMDVYEALVEVGLELARPPSELLGFVESGMAAADRQSGPHLDAELEQEYRARMHQWREQISSARPESGG